jgi:Flp pilus assembly protein TadG
MAQMNRTSARKRHRSSGIWACERGAELIEFALIFPTLLMVVLGIIDFGFLFQRYEVVTNAAREGARVAILPGYANADVEARVNQYLTAAGLTDPSTTAVGAAQAITVGTQCITVRPVTVTYDAPLLFLGPIFGMMGGGSFRTLTSTSSMRTEIAAGACP